jgi:hypothetical protein
MKIYSPTITGSAENTNIVTTTSITSLNALSASFASTASFVQNAQSASYVLNAVSASRAVSSSRADSATTASYVLNAVSSSFAATSSYANSFTVGGTLTAQTINVQIITSSIEFNTGSTRNGALSTNTHQFTGSVLMSGSLNVGSSATVAIGTSSDPAVIVSGNTSATISGNAKRLAQFRYNTADSTGIDLGYDATAGNGIIAGGTSANGAGIDFWTYNGSAWGNRVTINKSGSVGIGVTNPQTQFHISGDLTFTEVGFDTVRKHQIVHSHSDGNSANNNIRFLVSDGSGNTAERMRINGSGFVGIGSNAPGELLQVNGSICNPVDNSCITAGNDKNVGFVKKAGFAAHIGTVSNQPFSFSVLNQTTLTSANISAGSLSTVATLSTGGVFSSTGGGTSDRRKKKNIEYITSNALPIIDELKPASFIFKEYEGDKIRRGFIAQDVLETSIPDLVLGDGELETGTYGLDYDGILALAVKAIQELKSENDTLKEILQRNNIQ